MLEPPVPRPCVPATPPSGRAERPELDGYLVHRLLGRGGSATVWSATAPDGGDVALKVVHSAAQTPALLHEAALLCRLRHPHVVAMRAVERTGAGLVLVLDRAPGGSLGALVRARGPLEVGEVVTVLAALAGALAELHEQGLVHGDVAPGNVLFAADATPLLADWGLAAVVGAPGVGLLAGDGDEAEAGGTPGFADPAQPPGGSPTPAGDVHGLAAVAWYALTGQVPAPSGERVPLPLLVPEVPRELAALLDAATSPVPGRRPTAAELAHGCTAAAAAEPVHLVPGDPLAEPAELLTHRLRAAAAQAQQEQSPRRRERSAGRWVALGRAAAGVAAAGAVFAGAWAVSAWLVDPRPPLAAAAGRPGDAGAAGPGERAAAPRADVERAVADLAARRAEAYLQSDVALLAEVDAPGSVAEQVDTAAIEAMREQGTTVRGLGYDVRWTEVVPGDDLDGQRTAAVRAVVATSAHEQVHADGSVVAVPASGPLTSLLLLEEHDGRWLLAGTG